MSYRIPLSATVITSALIMSLILGLPAPSHGAKRIDKAVFGYSLAHYQRVGNYDARLSRACQQRLFGQKRLYRYIVSFVGDEGRAILGIAASNWNLYDPHKMAGLNKTYHFYHDGYSDCAVYVSPQPQI